MREDLGFIGYSASVVASIHRAQRLAVDGLVGRLRVQDETRHISWPGVSLPILKPGKSERFVISLRYKNLKHNRVKLLLAN